MVEEPEETEEEDEETCEPCVQATGISFYNDLIKRTAGRKPAKILLDGVVHERITPQEFFTAAKRIIKKHGKPEHLEEMKAIDSFIQENLSSENL